MKKNQGHKPTKPILHPIYNKTTWSLSRGNGNIKHFCLYCFKTFKTGGGCCGRQLFPISSQARPPKANAHKSEWKQFISLFIYGSRSNNIEVLNRIIAIRKEFKLPTIEVEKRVEVLKAVEATQPHYFDIDPEKLIKLVYNDTHSLSKDISDTTDKLIDKLTTDIFKTQHEYYMMPIGFNSKWDIKLFTEEKFYKLYKVRAFQSHHQDRVFNFRIKTDDLNIEISNETYYSSRRNYNRASMLYFESKEKAMVFRSEFLRVIYPILKDHITFNDKIKKDIVTDYNRVLRKKPELLV